jgi:hypothetical protein
MQAIEVLIIILVLLLVVVVIRPYIEPSVESALNPKVGEETQKKAFCGIIDSPGAPIFPSEASKGEYVFETSVQLHDGSSQLVFLNYRTRQMLVSVPAVSGCIIETDPQDGSKGPKFPVFLADNTTSVPAMEEVK